MPLVDLLETVFHIGFRPESLDDARTRNRLLELAEDAPQQALRLNRVGAEPARDARDDEGRHRQGDERDERQPRRHIEKHQQEAQHQDRFTQEHVEAARHGVLHLRHVVRQAGKHVALAAGGKPAHRKRSHLGKQFLVPQQEDFLGIEGIGVLLQEFVIGLYGRLLHCFIVQFGFGGGLC